MNDSSQPNGPKALVTGAAVDGGTAGDDELCERIRADARRLAGLGRAPDLDRYLQAIASLRDRPAVLDTAIVAVIDGAIARGSTRDEVIEGLVRDHPTLRAAILAADFLDQTLGSGGGGTGGAEPVPELPFDLGPVLPDRRRRYELRTRIAEGASGVVYRAVDRAVSTSDGVSMVAVKCLRDVGFRLPHHFKLEAQRSRRVEHSSVARVLDAGEDARAGEYLVFEYCEGPTLEQWLTRRASRPGIDEAMTLVLALADGIGAVHRAGFCHGDIHPGNVIVSREGRPRLIDFGAARSDVSGLSVGAGAVGALGFAAPEIFRGVPGVTGQSADTYAVAGLLFWMLTGEPPNGASIEEAEATIGGERIVDIGRVRPRARDLHAVLGRALGPDCASRYATIESLSEDLRRVQRAEPLTWSPGPWRHRVRLAVRRAPVAFALGAGMSVALVAGAVSVLTALYLSERAEVSTSRTLIAAKQSELEVTQARALAAEANAAKVEMLRTFASAFSSYAKSVTSDSDASRWIAAIILMERLNPEGADGDAIARAETSAKRVELAQRFTAPVLERGRIGTMEELIIGVSLGLWGIEDGQPAKAWPVLNLARSAAHEMLRPEDPAAARIDAYWSIATVMLGEQDPSRVPDADVAEARRVAHERQAVIASLPARTRSRVPASLIEPEAPAR